MISLADLTDLLHYEPIQGIFTWRKNHGPKKEGEIAKGENITIDGKRYKLGVIAWFYTYGRWAGKHFNFINNDPVDIRLTNLTNRKLYKRKPAIPVDRISCTIEIIDNQYQVWGSIGRVVSDLGVFEDYDLAIATLSVWMKCSQ